MSGEGSYTTGVNMLYFPTTAYVVLFCPLGNAQQNPCRVPSDFFVVLLLAKESLLRRLVLSIFFIAYPENAKYPHEKNCVPCSSHKIVWKLAYLCVKMTSLYQRYKLVMKITNLGVSKLLISVKDIK